MAVKLCLMDMQTEDMNEHGRLIVMKRSLMECSNEQSLNKDTIPYFYGKYQEVIKQ